MADETDNSGLATRTFDTVTPSYVGRPDTEMHAIGLLLFAILAILLIPLLPFLAAYWAIGRLAKARRGTDLDPNFHADAEDRTRSV